MFERNLINRTIWLDESCRSDLFLLYFSNKKSPVPEDATALFGPPLETAFDDDVDDDDDEKTSEGTSLYRC